MRQATSQEPVSDSGHSLILESSESNNSSSLKSAAMLGIALSVGASGALIPSPDAAAATSRPTLSATTEAFSSDTQAAASADAATTQQIVGYHTIASGESLWQIAQQHRVGLQDLKAANALAPETSISVGQVLKVPAAQSGTVARVRPESVKLASAALESVTGTASTPAETASSKLASAEIASAETASSKTASSQSAVLEMTVTPEVTTEDITPQVDIADASLPSIQPESAEAPEPVVTAYAPTPATSNYQVQLGDTLRSIASSMGTTPEAIVKANSLIDPDVIFVGSTLVVPSTSLAAQPAVEKASPAAALEGAVSMGGEAPTAQNLLSSIQNAESRDPYVANLLAEVEEIRTQSVEVSEAESVELESDASSTEGQLIASASDRISRLSLPGSDRASAEPVEAIEDLQVDRAEADSDLLAAAPLSPDAYIPAQRSAGQVVSPDMPLLPSEDEYLPEAPNFFDGYVWPTQGTVTSGYGWRWGRMHRGVDVAGPVGTPIVAAAVGVVERAGWTSGGYGNIVEIRHPDGSMTRYAHNNSVSVSQGQSVKQGQQIAEMGSTGYSTGPHLHFEVHQGGAAVNPVAYLPGR